MTTTNANDFDLEFVEATDNGETPDAPVNDGTPQIPDKYQNKSVEDIIKMHQEAEKKASRLANEVAQTRKLADTLLDIKTPTAPVPKKDVTPVTTDDLFSDPNTALQRTIENSSVADKVDAAQKRLDNLETSLGRREFESAYPTYMQDVQDPAFQEWVAKNPARQGLLVAADRYDFNAARSLWDMWGEYKEISGNARQNAANSDRQNRIRAAKTVKSAAADSVDDNARPIYSRQKLMDLRIRAANGDERARAKYESPEFQQEMVLAYQEGRVR